MSLDAPQEAAAQQVPRPPSPPGPTIAPLDSGPQLLTDNDGKPEIPQESANSEGIADHAPQNLGPANREAKDELHETEASEDDGISIASSDLRGFAGGEGWGPGAYTDVDMKDSREQAGKYAQVTGIYVEGLEARVSALENEVSELQVQLGTRKKEEEEKEEVEEEEEKEEEEK